MRLPLDELIAATVAVALRDRGHDVVAVQDVGLTHLRGVNDCELLEHAARQRRAVVTDNIRTSFAASSGDWTAASATTGCCCSPTTRSLATATMCSSARSSPPCSDSCRPIPRMTTRLDALAAKHMTRTQDTTPPPTGQRARRNVSDLNPCGDVPCSKTVAVGGATDRQMSRQLHVVVRAFSRRGA